MLSEEVEMIFLCGQLFLSEFGPVLVCRSGQGTHSCGISFSKGEDGSSCLENGGGSPLFKMLPLDPVLFNSYCWEITFL